MAWESPQYADNLRLLLLNLALKIEDETTANFDIKAVASVLALSLQYKSIFLLLNIFELKQ